MTPHDEARQLLLSEAYGVLSTHSAELPGYPFGSVVPYSLDRSGCPVILISRIAQHTKNIQHNSKISLIVLQKGANDVQANGRLTLIGDAEKISVAGQPIEDHHQDDASSLNDIAERYYRRYPGSRDYHKTHDFDFYRINAFRARFIGGFGNIRWLDAAPLFKPNPFSSGQESAIVEHMNEDHIDAVHHYFSCHQRDKGQTSDAANTLVTMTAIDAEGIDLISQQGLTRIIFSRAISTPMEARQLLVEMTKEG